MPDRSANRGLTLLYLALALAVPLIYASVTHQVWEDYYITLRHSKNLVEGNGLVFNPGRRVQGFTSAINVMTPAIFYAISGRSETVTLFLYRTISLSAFVFGGWVLLRLLLADRPANRWIALIFILLYVTEAKTVAFTMNGQESAFMVAFLAIAFVSIHRGIARNWKLAAISWTGLLYTRPDAPIYIAALAITAIVFRIENFRETLRGMMKAAGISAAVFAPWFFSAWIYYGNPIPNTAIAKSSFSAVPWFDFAGLMIETLGRYVSTSTWVFEPIYAALGGWPANLLHPFALTCAVICTIYWAIPNANDRLGRMASLLFTITALYMSYINVASYTCPWYLPSVSIFGTITLARAVHPLLEQVHLPARAIIPATRFLQLYFVTIATSLLVMQAWQFRIQQREIEDNLRRPLGEFLRKFVPVDQRIYLEPIGYIGYFSDRLIWDWPGLVTPEIVHLHRQKHLEQESIIPEIRPEWLVVRASEAIEVVQDAWASKNYSVVKTFDARPALQSYGYFPGRDFLDADSLYYVLKRNDVALPAGILN